MSSSKLHKKTRFRLHYYVSNNGDGSASVRPQPSAADAEKACEAQSEGWGENSASYETLKVEDGKIFYRHNRWDGTKHHEEWIPLEEVKE